MSADIRTWLERLRGHGRSQVCTLEPADCRDLVRAIEALTDAWSREAELRMAQHRIAELEAWQLEVAEATGYVNHAEGQAGYEVADSATVAHAIRERFR